MIAALYIMLGIAFGLYIETLLQGKGNTLTLLEWFVLVLIWPAWLGIYVVLSIKKAIGK